MRGASRALCRATWMNMFLPLGTRAQDHNWGFAENKRVELVHCPTGSKSAGTGGEHERVWPYHPLCFMRALLVPFGTILKIAGDAGGGDVDSDASEEDRMEIEGDVSGGDGVYGEDGHNGPRWPGPRPQW